jgi:hypothetical protein
VGTCRHFHVQTSKIRVTGTNEHGSVRLSAKIRVAGTNEQKLSKISKIRVVGTNETTTDAVRVRPGDPFVPCGSTF